MLLRLVAPFRCHFNVNNHQTLCHVQEYADFWERTGRPIRDQLAAYPAVKDAVFLHARLGPATMRYQKIHENGSLIPPEVLQVVPSGDVGPLLADAVRRGEDALQDPKLRGAVAPLVETLLFHVYDNTIGLAEVSLDLDERWCEDPAEQRFAELQAWTNAFMNHLLPAYYRSSVYPMLLDLWRVDGREEFIETPGEYAGFPDVTLAAAPSRFFGTPAPDFDPAAAGHPLWVNRTLCIKGAAPEVRDQVLRHWVPSAGGHAELEKLFARPESVFLGWGHNIMDARPEGLLARDAWQALLLCQYFYTVLESTSLTLSRFVGMSLGRLSRRQMRQMSAVLQDIVSTVNLLIAQFNDTQQNLQGNRQLFLKDLKERWGIDAMVQSIEKKSAMVTQQIDHLYDRLTKVSQSVIETMLFAIGGIGLVEFCLNLAVYARTPLGDSKTLPGDDAVPGLLDLGAAVPADAVLWAGLGLLAVAFGLFLAFQRQRR
jgi:hypothetical protein